MKEWQKQLLNYTIILIIVVAGCWISSNLFNGKQVVEYYHYDSKIDTIVQKTKDSIIYSNSYEKANNKYFYTVDSFKIANATANDTGKLFRLADSLATNILFDTTGQ